MRLIGTVKEHRQAYRFYSFLQEKKVECSYEPDAHQEDCFQFWITHEDEFDIATHWLEEFQKNPKNPYFDVKEPLTPKISADEEERDEKENRGGNGKETGPAKESSRNAKCPYFSNSYYNLSGFFLT